VARINRTAEKGDAAEKSLNFRITEAHRLIRTNLLYTLANAKSRVVVFSSAEPSAGKSTLCSNLSLVMAQSGARVLLIDADLRKPVQHRHFHLRKTDGLSKVLGGLADLSEAIHRQVAPNLDVLLAGAIPPNPSELLGSDRMKALVEAVSKEYDYVFIDTPPVGVVADALVLASLSAGVVLVARQKQTTYDELEESVEAITRIKSKLLGVVLIDVKEERIGYSRPYVHRYYRYANYRYKVARGENDDD